MTKVLVYVLVAGPVIAFFMFLVQTLWNSVVPEVFSGMHAITYWQACELSLLSGLLIRSGTAGSKT